MKAKVIAETTVNNLPVKVGSIVEVDEVTFENLSRKGRLSKVSEEKIADAENPTQSEKPAKKKAE